MFKPIWVSVSFLTRREKIIFAFLVGSRVAVQLLDVLGLAAVGLLGAMVASGLTNRTDASFFGLTVSIESSSQYLWVALVVAGFFITKSTLATILLRLTTAFLARVEARSASEVARFVYSSDLSRLKEFSRGEIQWAVSGSSSIAFSGLLYSATSLVTELALFASVFTVLILVDLSTALIITAYFFALLAVFQVAINRRLRRIGERISASNVVISDTLFDLTNGFREALVLERRGYFLDRFAEYRLRQSLDAGLQRFLMGIPRYFIEAALMVGVIALIVWQFYLGTLSEGLVTVGVFVTGGVRMMAALLPLQGAIAGIRSFGPQAEDAQLIFKRALGESAEPRESLAAHDQASADSIKSDIYAESFTIRAQGVDFRYPDGAEKVLHDISLEIPEGSFAAIIGPSGAGKTTLVDLILGVVEPTAGTMRVGNHPPSVVRKVTPGLIGYVPQKPGLVSGNVAQNIALGVPEDKIDYSMIEDVLRRSELWDFVQTLPEGVHASIGKQQDALSGGQIQRLGLARALYSRPRLLVLDEATSALDAGTEASISRTIEDLGGEMTVVVVAHRLSTIQNANIVFAVSEGRLLAEGTFGEVRKSVPMIEDFVQLMSIKD